MLTYQADTCVPARVCFAAAPPPRVDPTGQTVQTQVPAAAWHVQEVDVFGEELVLYPKILPAPMHATTLGHASNE